MGVKTTDWERGDDEIEFRCYLGSRENNLGSKS